MTLRTKNSRPAPIAKDDVQIGVVIPVYNRGATLCRTLSFVVQQTTPPARLVIVDDGSTDDTADVVEQWLAAAPRPFAWQVLRQRHQTAAAARSLGSSAIDDLPLVAYLDSDDHWPANFLERTSRALLENPRAVAATTDRRYFDQTGRIVREDDCAGLADDPIRWMFYQGAGIASCSLFRTAAIRRAGGWNPAIEMAEDFKLFVDVALEGQWLYVGGEPVEFQLGNAALAGEACNLTRRYVDNNRRWAGMYEEVFADVTVRSRRIARRELSRAIALVWGRAGKELLSVGRTAEARACFRRSIRWKPTMLRSWRRLALAGFRKSATSSPSTARLR